VGHIFSENSIKLVRYIDRVREFLEKPPEEEIALAWLKQDSAIYKIILN
jgi:hypothetical protein